MDNFQITYELKEYKDEITLEWIMFKNILKKYPFIFPENDRTKEVNQSFMQQTS